MNIPVVVVDNADADRYIARRRFSRSEGFGEVLEYRSGRDFVREFSKKFINFKDSSAPTVVLMDISMPGRDGFQVISEFLSYMNMDSDDPNVIFMMYTSSSASLDREQAASMKAVRGYIEKPLNDHHLKHIRELAGVA